MGTSPEATWLGSHRSHRSWPPLGDCEWLAPCRVAGILTERRVAGAGVPGPLSDLSLMTVRNGFSRQGMFAQRVQGREEGGGVTGYGQLGASPARPLDGRGLHWKAGGTRGWAQVATDGYQPLGGMAK